MHRFLSPVFLSAFCAVGGANCPKWERLSVKVFNDANTEKGILNSAKLEAGWLLKPLCIEPIWVECRIAATEAETIPCEGPFGAVELRVSWNTKSAELSGLALGIAFVGANRVTIFLERILELVATNGGIIDAGGLLGHVMAHEIGHLLLHSTTHTGEGIMRSEFRRSDLKRAAQRHLTFTRDQVETIRRSLLMKIR